MKACLRAEVGPKNKVNKLPLVNLPIFFYGTAFYFFPIIETMPISDNLYLMLYTTVENIIISHRSNNYKQQYFY